jgi:guanylate kinase
MEKKGLLVVISGFSGSGKGTLMKELLKRYDDTYALSISATTRSPREGELHGREYFFVTKAEFEKMIENEELIEYAGYVGNYYGTPKPYVLSKLLEGKDVILEIEVQGATDLKKRYPEAVMIFITPPDKKTLEKRLIGRGTESKAQIENRLERAAKEADSIKNYDYLIINDDIDETVEKIHNLIQVQHCLIKYNKEVIEKIKEDLCHKEEN